MFYNNLFLFVTTFSHKFTEIKPIFASINIFEVYVHLMQEHEAKEEFQVQLS